jgi:two-component system, LuxR family, response regulator FixJ
MDSSLTVFVVDDDDDFRDSLVWLLESADFSVRQMNSAEQFLAQYQGEHGCLLLDIRMSGMSGLALQQQLRDKAAGLPVIIITGHGDVTLCVKAMKNAAVDFIEKPFDDEVLFRAVNEALALCERQLTQFSQQEDVRSRWQSLSKRESQVAKLVIQSFSTREIAQQLELSVKTIEIHRSQIMKKMKAKNVADLVAKTAKVGLDLN